MLTRRFFMTSGRTVLTEGLVADFSVPEPVEICNTPPDRTKVEGFAARLRNEIGYLAHREPLSQEAEEALDSLRIQGMLIVPISQHQMSSALHDGNARTVLHALTQQGRGGDNLFLTRNALIDRRFLFGRSEMLARMGSALGRGEQLPPEGVELSKLSRRHKDGLRHARHLCLIREIVDEGTRRYIRGPGMFFDWFAEAPASEPWDLAISYASEDEPVAREIKKRLGDEFRVFFAPDEEAWMWGEDLDRVLPKLYGVECRYVLVLSTEAYCAKHWTRVEFEAARTRTGRLLVVNLGKLPDDMPRDVLYREGSPAGLVGLLDDLRMRLERLLNARASCAICASAAQREDAQGARFWNDV